MGKIVSLILALILALSTGVSATAEGQYGPLGRLKKLNVTDEMLNEALKDNLAGEVFSRYVFFDSLAGLVLALFNEDISIIEIDRNTAEYIASRLEYFVVREPYIPATPIMFSMLLREEDSELCDRISAVIREMDADGSLAVLQKTYIDDIIASITGAEPDPVAPKTFDGAETLRVAVTGDRPPMDYFSPDDRPAGYNTALIAEIAARMKMNVEFVSIDTGARGIALATGRADVVFWIEEKDSENGEGATGEDIPEMTIATDCYLKSPVAFVVLDSSPLAELLEPAE